MYPNFSRSESATILATPDATLPRVPFWLTRLQFRQFVYMQFVNCKQLPTRQLRQLRQLRCTTSYA